MDDIRLLQQRIGYVNEPPSSPSLPSSPSAMSASIVQSSPYNPYHFEASPTKRCTSTPLLSAVSTPRRSPRLNIHSPFPMRRSPRLSVADSIPSNVKQLQNADRSVSRRKPPVRQKMIASRKKNSNSTRASLSKRKVTLFSKVHELWQITGADVLLIIEINNLVRAKKTYYGGSQRLVESYETFGVSRNNKNSCLYGKYDDGDIHYASSDEDFTADSSVIVPKYMESSLPSKETESTMVRKPTPNKSPSPPIGTTAVMRTTKAATHKQTTKKKIGEELTGVVNEKETHTAAVIRIDSRKQHSAESGTKKNFTRKLHFDDNDDQLTGNIKVMQQPVKELTVGTWVAVAFYESYYIGQITETIESENKVKVKFLEKKCKKFHWPKQPDVAMVLTLYVFMQNLKMSLGAGRNLTYTCACVSDVQKAYLKFKKENKNIL